MEAELLAA
jgi:hypothetical protein